MFYQIFNTLKNDTIFSEIFTKHFSCVFFAYHFLRDLLCENMRAKMFDGNIYQNLTTLKNDTTIICKYTAMHRLPSASLVPRGFPEGLSCGTLGVDERRCMGAVRRLSRSLRLAQHPLGVLRGALGAGVGGHGQQYDE